MKTLILIPTYNERENAQPMAEQILALGLDADLVFMDDHSPDGTGEILDRFALEHSKVSVLHRSGKLGIGSAHRDGIAFAYSQGYQRLITMDCDFTHSPADLPRLIEASHGFDVTVGSRHLRENSLPGWNFARRFLTKFGHFLTRNLLKIHVDASGAFRLYDLERIPPHLFDLVTARGYAFFFMSIFILTRNHFSINELPIVLPARTYGHSKMSFREILRSVLQLLSLWKSTLTNPGQFRMAARAQDLEIHPDLIDPQGWDAYWDKKERKSTVLYEIVATLYRVTVIKPRLERYLFKHFKNTGGEVRLLHAGCGSGQVDENLHRRLRITAIDISPSALRIYHRNNPAAFSIKHASILKLPFERDSFDGVYNLGVVEHFTHDEIRTVLGELHRVLKPKGKIVLFWPRSCATSVAVLDGLHWLMNDVFNRQIRLHPVEISLLQSKEQAASLLDATGFRMIDYAFGPRDFFVQAAVVAEKV